MARTAAETATTLSTLYDEFYGQDSFVPFRITWPQLRTLAAVPRLEESYIKEINTMFLENGQKTLIPLNNYLLVVRDWDMNDYRMVPDRLLEQYLPDEGGVPASGYSEDGND